MSTARVDFTRSAAERIAAVVRTVEGQVDEASPLRFGRAQAEEKRVVFRICTFTGSWSKNLAKTVTLKFTTSTPNTFVATNLFAEIATATASTRNCAIGKEGTAWYLIAAEC